MPNDNTAVNRQAPAFEDYECQGALFRILKTDFLNGQAVHAYLVSGEEGIGKKTLVGLLTQTLLCTGEHPPCGQCGGCVRCLHGTHPDVMRLKREKDKASIGVDAVRDVIAQVGRHAYEGGRRVVIIEEAETMTPQAQNCFLKTLEEPVADVVFFLIARDASKLLPTIVSRCRPLRLCAWPDVYVLDKLLKSGVSKETAQRASRAAYGNIGLALDIAADEAYWQRRRAVMESIFMTQKAGQILPLSNQQKEEKGQAAALLKTVEEMFRELLLVRSGCLDEDAIADYPIRWQEIARSAPPETFDRLFSAVKRARILRENQVNWQAAYEALLVDIMEEANQWQR